MVFVLCSLFLIVCFLFYTGQGIYLAKNSSGQEEVFLIKKGESIREIAAKLESQNLIKNDFFFLFYSFLGGDSRKLQAGEYLVSSSQNIPEITRKFVKGEVIKEKITVVEGWNLRDIGWYFENNGIFQAEEILELVGFPGKDFSNEFNFLEDKPKNLGLEGYLFPDTYEIDKEEGVEEVIRKMLRNFDRKLTLDLREEIEKQGKTIFEIVTMASLLEKEVKTKEDKEIVSGILWKRLENNVPLQVDATITYILRYKTTNPEGVAPRPYGARISKEDLQIDSPYNTYKYRGLPLGPICNPGLDSILAAMYPEDSGFWYYLSPWVAELRSSPASLRSAEDEGTIFSETLEKHNIAKEKYLR